MERFKKRNPCPVCQGGDDMPRGKGLRCHGFLSGDGFYAHCTNDNAAGSLTKSPKDDTYHHRLNGPCKCGMTHGQALEVTKARKADKRQEPEWVPIVPVPEEAAKLKAKTKGLGAPVVVWDIRDQSGTLLGYTARYEKKDGDTVDKKVLPWTWCRDANPETQRPDQWRMKGLPEPRPLYGLPDLAAKPDAPVLLVEGEKSRDAAAKIFPDLVVLSCLNGCNGPSKTDFSPLVGREVIAWPDADEEGRKWAALLGDRLANIADPLRAVSLPPGLPDGWDLADPWPEAIADTEAARRLIAEAKAYDQEAIAEAIATWAESEGKEEEKRFSVSERGTWYRTGDGWGLMCGPLHIKAVTRDMDGENHGRLLEWADGDGRARRWVVPMRYLAGDAATVRERLMGGGLYVNPKQAARTALIDYLQQEVEERVTCADRLGWHGSNFLLPDACFGPDAVGVLYQDAGDPPPIKEAGTLEDWQQTVGAWAVGNSRLVFALSAAFAPPLLRLVGDDSGGFHFRGKTSTGKTTLIEAAGSVWGGGGTTGHKNQWRTTGNGLEAIATKHNDCLLTLDELEMIDAKEAGSAVYLLANQKGKVRASRNGDAKAANCWRLLFLSSGEISLAAHIQQAGKTTRAGQDVRFAEVPADVSEDLGVWEELHGHEGPGAFSDAIKQASRTHYGVPIRAFLRRLVQEDPAKVRDGYTTFRGRFLKEVLPPGASGEVRRVAGRFALVAGAGILATKFGVVPWSESTATDAAKACFHAWLDDRGTIGSTESAAVVDQVRAFIQENGSSRFALLKPGEDEGERDERVISRVGFRHYDETDGRWKYIVFADAFRHQLCRGHEWRRAAKDLKKAGLLLPSEENRLMHRLTLPGMGWQSVYVLTIGEGGEA